MNETTGRAETISLPGITLPWEYQIEPGGPRHVVHVTPTVIHYAEDRTLIGNQVVEPGLVEHAWTMRWMKPSIARGVGKRRKTGQGHKGPSEAGEDFLKLLINYASDRISPAEDSFTFTAPVEAFETFQEWLLRITESLGIRRVRLLDEPTAAIFGYQGTVRKDDRFQVFDFGGGTLDCSVVRLDLGAAHDRKAVQIGTAGDDLGGMSIDLWLAGDFASRHDLDDFAKRELEALILRQAEAVKIALSEPNRFDAEMAVVDTCGRRPRLLRTVYLRECQACLGTRDNSRPAGDGCLGCVLKKNQFLARVEETVDRALENAAIKAGLRRSDLTKVTVTGGTSLMPCIRRYLEQKFPGKVEYDHPFDSVVRGACQGASRRSYDTTIPSKAAATGKSTILSPSSSWETITRQLRPRW
ncbi:MAG: Hsp70 family protein [Acidobacteria bacterium]|nr:Hsp70 family protein [Acidobacteriota bacterium]